ncbi:MAG: hypothetical protein IJ180_10250 [Bacteroidales bacterium]|nr:hypothetical protein [Bacteroidales bacterium]
MKRVVAIVVFMVLSVVVSAQINMTDTLQRLCTIYASEGDISKTGRLIIVSRGGEVLTAKDIYTPLNRVILNEEKSEAFHGIKFFNGDTAIVVGTLNERRNKEYKSYYYLTFDAGETWQKKEINNDGRYFYPYVLQVNEKGECWITAAEDRLFYSEDFGQSFKRLNNPFAKENRNRIYGLIMKNSLEGVAESSGEKVAITKDNWNTYEFVNEDFETISKQYKTEKPKYKYDRFDGIIEFNDKDTTLIPLYVNERIPDPQKIIFGFEKDWGYDYDELFYRNTKDGDNGLWIRENVFDFSVVSLRFLDKDNFLIYTGRKNYQYNILTKQIKEYKYEKPLENFLSSDIEKLVVKYGSAGCFHSYEDYLIYNTKGDLLYCNTLYKTDVSKEDVEKIGYNSKLPLKTLTDILKNINENYDYIPTKKDLNITKDDIENYDTVVNKIIEEENSYLSDSKKIKPEEELFFKNFAKQIFDTISEETLREFLTMSIFLPWSTTQEWVTMEIYNKKGEKIEFCFTTGDDDSNPYLFPQTMVFNNGKDFIRLYNLELSKYLVPLWKGQFEKYMSGVYFLEHLSKYMHSKQRK